MSYDVAVDWDLPKAGVLTGVWSISSVYPETGTGPAAWGQATGLAPNAAALALKRTLVRDLDSHTAWWRSFWAKSTIRLPDPVLEKQWYLEIYKFGAASRRGAPPITLQAVWTADDGSLPPWKGDYHNDLNTAAQLLALLQRKPPGRGPGFPGLALGHQAALRRIYKAVFRG